MAFSFTADAVAHALTNGLLEKYNTAGPRYTSYPTVPNWSDAFDANAYGSALAEVRQQNSTTPLSLYVHLPFCEARCLFCSCNVVITQQREQAEKYLDYLFREIDMLAERIETQRRPVVQYHWGGGTPTYLSPEQIARLFRHQTERFALAPNAEVSIEVDPRVTTDEHLETLRALGFNRLSMGVQDVDAQVQQAVNRIQPVETTERLMQRGRELGFASLNIDLIYGLPYQTAQSFAPTVDEIIRLEPDRIALYNFAYVPWMSPHHKQLPAEAMPPAEEKFAVFRMAMQRLTEAGYVYIGMDHFAKPDDELALALHNGQLSRNFMGYTVDYAGPQQGRKSELIGAGVSAISGLERYFAQNHRKLSGYYDAIDAGQLPTLRGYALSADDILRREVILAVLCQGRVRYADFESAYGIDFKAYFASSLTQLAEPLADGLIAMDDEGFALTTLGRILSRNVAMPFDAYYHPDQAAAKPMFSRTV